MKIRKFKLENGNAVADNKDGEYIHMNDLELYLILAKRREESYVESCKDDKSEWMQKSVESANERMRLIDDILRDFIYNQKQKGQ